MEKILLIDDDSVSLQILSKVIQSLGYECLPFQDPRLALLHMRQEKFDVVMTDLIMPVIDGMKILEEALKIDRYMQVLFITSLNDLAPAVEAMKLGAADYIQKPLTREQVSAALVRALNKKKLIDENRSLKAQLNNIYNFRNIIGRSEAILKIFHQIERVAKTNASVLIYGESGTGKEMIARAIHDLSERAEDRFIGVDCVSIPKQLFESELFGFEKGAFTGANMTRNGLLYEADKGTFFLDEVTEMDIALQGKLLRVLQERQFRRVGGRELIDLDVRVLAATRRNPLEAVKRGLFREDLYYRLNVLPLVVPPLRERKEDIPLLIESFLEEHRNEYNTEIEIDTEALLKLQAYDWPGNVRELKNVIFRLCVMANQHKIELHDLPENILRGDKGREELEILGNLSFKDAKDKWLEGFEINYLKFALKRHQGNITEAAKTCEVNRKTFQRLISKHGLNRKKF